MLQKALVKERQTHVFSNEIVLEKFKLDDEEVNSGRFTPFISIRQSRENLEIFEVWKQHFKGYIKGIKKRIKYQAPFVVTQHPKNKQLTLWIR